MDRLVKVVAHDGTATLYEYDANGNRTAMRYANGMIVKYEYDTVNRLVLEKVLDKDANVVVQYTYTLGAAGERTKVVETGADPAGERTVEYAYDALYRLTSETVTDANGVSVTEYTYDSNSNRLTKTVDGAVTEYSYNELNQLVSETGIHLRLCRKPHRKERQNIHHILSCRYKRSPFAGACGVQRERHFISAAMV